MKTMNGLFGAALVAPLLLSIGCAAGPAEVRIQGITVPESLVDRAENGSGAGQAEACLVLAQKLWERDRLESLRLLRRGAELRSAEACRQYLIRSESAEANVSQRVYARLYVEGLLRKGPMTTPAGRDLRPELYTQLCWGWRYTEPRCASKAKQVLEALLDGGLTPEQARSPFLVQMLQETGLRASRTGARAQDVSLYAGEAADEAKAWLRVPLAGERGEHGDWISAEAMAWGGGSDRLFLGTNVLAFLVNAQGEPSFKGRSLWIVNLGTSPVYLTSLATGQANLELAPGREELLPVSGCSLDRGDCTTGVSLSIRHRRLLR
ncbi:MAG TPA: hypothetical protein VKW04_17900 [Planctomycetota bacterium]|nr:hypothetical protein [Planctomycetota bacterium]